MLGTLCCSLLLQLALLLGAHGGLKTEPQLDVQEQGLFRGSDQYDFAVALSASELRCFWHFAHQDGRFYLTYMIQRMSGFASDRRVLVTVLTPKGFLVTSSNDAVQQINFQTQETGFYQMCFTNIYNSFGSIQVFLNFGVYYKGVGRVQQKNSGKDYTDTLHSIADTSIRLHGLVFHMWRHYNFARMKRGTDYYVLLANWRYVTWWSAAQSVLIILAGYLQLFFLKRLIHNRMSKVTNKPRC
ncbi:transmembrane emp24 domain-containing protein 6-like [Scleropages formosus]|uniref:Transmembrane emp24 domain-containing protein 6-like n=1 Tax=Scleropages formosus TaxID=113540 RepID=A0A8C9QLC8_SCLFO|nr:transmembrane emp24 domain-containing protein 6-like [Scleropages formosus]